MVLNKMTTLKRERIHFRKTCEYEISSFMHPILAIQFYLVSLIPLIARPIIRKSIENVLHSLTGDYFHEQISRSIQRSNEELDNTEGIIPGAQTNKFTNPLAALSSTFLEPILNVINVYILAVRTVFNITHWKDPYLSFLFLVMLIVLMLLLAVFPWRSFFYTSGTVLFGPQVSKKNHSLLLRPIYILISQLQCPT